MIFWRTADGKRSGEQRTEAKRTLSEWLTYIGIGAAVIGLALATGGASVPATVMIVTAKSCGAGAAAAAMAEKSEQGMLTTMDITVGVLTILAELGMQPLLVWAN